MSNWQSQHLDDGLALRYLDGELPARKARQVRRHLEACWQCRAEIEALEATVADCMRYRKQVLEAHLPEAAQAVGRPLPRFRPHRRRVERRAFLEAAGPRSAVSGLERRRRRGGRPGLRRVLSASRNAFGAGGRAAQEGRGRGRNQARRPAPLPHPDQHRAGDADAGHRQIRECAPAAGHGGHVRGGALRRRRSAERPLVRRLARQPPEKRDEVDTVDDCYQIRTSTDTGELASATLRLRAEDLRRSRANSNFAIGIGLNLPTLRSFPIKTTVLPLRLLGNLRCGQPYQAGQPQSRPKARPRFPMSCRSGSSTRDRGRPGRPCRSQVFQRPCRSFRCGCLSRAPTPDSRPAGFHAACRSGLLQSRRGSGAAPSSGSGARSGFFARAQAPGRPGAAIGRPCRIGKVQLPRAGLE